MLRLYQLRTIPLLLFTLTFFTCNEEPQLVLDDQEIFSGSVVTILDISSTESDLLVKLVIAKPTPCHEFVNAEFSNIRNDTINVDIKIKNTPVICIQVIAMDTVTVSHPSPPPGKYVLGFFRGNNFERLYHSITITD